MVRPDVSAVLFDEPLTVIGPALKWERRSKLKAVHRALDLLMIYVTHDQIEALTFADQVVVMNERKAVQIGSLGGDGVADADPMERREHDLADIRAAGHWSVRSGADGSRPSLQRDRGCSFSLDHHRGHRCLALDAAGHSLELRSVSGRSRTPSIRLPESTARAAGRFSSTSNCPSCKRFSSLPCCCASCRRS